MNEYSGIGLMSGTSLDGLDIAYCTFREMNGSWHFDIEVAETVAYDERWRNRLGLLAEQDAETYARTHVYYGHWLGRTVREFIHRHGLKPQFVASHGHTIFHQPRRTFTSQIGDGESAVAYLDCPFVGNFRNKNVALGGEGAPLVPFGEQALFPDYQVFLNLGGIANLGYRSRGFDVGPCNLVLNPLARMVDPEAKYDPDGAYARAGSVLPELYQALNALGYYQMPPPKSLGAEWIQEHVWPLVKAYPAAPEDLLHTLTRHLAFQVGEALRKMKVPPGNMLVTGGGYFNLYLRECLEKACAPLDIVLAEEVEQKVVEYKEALIFAFLGLMTLLGRPNILERTTGVDAPVLVGAVHLPASGYRAIL